MSFLKDFPNIDSHNDSLPEFFDFSNMKDQSKYSSPVPSSKQHSCPPISANSSYKQLQERATTRKYSPAKLESSKVRSPGILPYMNSPQVRRAGHDSINMSNHSLHKSSTSSPRLIRMLSCEESILEDDLDPLPPDICFEQVWQEQAMNLRHGVKGKAASAFITKDFSGKHFLGFYMQPVTKLRLLEILFNKDYNYSFGKIVDIECLDAGAPKNESLMVILNMTQNIQIYSGIQKISTINISSYIEMKDMASQRMVLNNFSSNSFVLSIKDGEMLRFELPVLSHSDKVVHCIEQLRNILSLDEYNYVYGKFYTLLHNSIDHVEVNCFQKFMEVSLKLLGFPEVCTNSLKPNYKSPAPPQPKKPKKSELSLGEEDWLYVMNFQKKSPCSRKNIEKKYVAEIRLQKHAPLFKHLSRVFLSWSAYYEELKLNVSEVNELLGLAKLLHYISRVIGLKNYVFLYEQDFPTLLWQDCDTVFQLVTEDTAPILDEIIQTSEIENISLYHNILSVLQNGGQKQITYASNHKTTNVLTKIYSAIIDEINNKDSPEHKLSNLKISNQRNLAKKLIDIMIEHSFSIEELDTLPIGYKLPIMNLIYKSKHLYEENISVEAAKFFGRDDIVRMDENRSSFKENISTPSESSKSGMDMNEEIFKFRFREDLRVGEVKKLLNSSVPVQVSIVQKPDVDDHSFAKEEELRLSVISNRTMALSIGRGMLTLDTSKPIASETVFIPTLEQSGKSTTTGKTITLTNDNATSKFNWPHFHNGVAAGLRIAPSASEIDPTWILFNRLKNSTLTPDHSGFLFALGLTGHLKMIPKLDLHDYLIKGHELTTIALLIGSSATQVGSQDSSIYKLICLHLDSLLPPTALDLNIPALTQVAAMISVGLLFFQSSNLHLIKTLLYEIGRPPCSESDHVTDYESHSLSAGLALGMIVMGKGKDSMMVADVNVASILYRYMIGGQKNDKVFTKIQTGKSNMSQIEEGSLINTNVTSPAAVIALSMMYFKTGNRRIADWFNVTLNAKTMDSMEADSLLLRTVAYCLIMWNEVVPTDEWIISVLPQYKDVLSAKLCDINGEIEIHYYVSIVTACCMALSLKYAATCNSKAFRIMLCWIDRLEMILKSGEAGEVCAKIFIEKCRHTVLLSLAVLMAGSGNIKVLRITRKLHKMCDVTYGMHMANSMAIGFLFLGGGRYSLKTDDVSIACLLCALYPRWPITSKDNRFHMQALRHLYYLACEPRLLLARDVDTNKTCYVPIAITLKDTEHHEEINIKRLSPCLLPELSDIKKIEVIGNRYFPLTLNFNEKFSLKDLEKVFVKKKVGCLSYSEDPKGKRNLLAITFKNTADKLDLINSLNSSDEVALFEKIFCSGISESVDVQAREVSSGISETEDTQTREDRTNDDCVFYLTSLHEYMIKEKIGLLKDFLFVEKMLKDIESGSCHGYIIRQLLFLLMFLEATSSKGDVISSVTLMQIRLRLTNAMEKKYSEETLIDHKTLTKYLDWRSDR